MSDQSAIDFEQLGIGEILTRYRLRVPANQRDYAWEIEQVTTLFEDIALAITEDENNYFLGTIVTVPIADGVLEVIDGQQRLATTTLALASMKKRVEQSNPNLARALDAFLIDIDPDTLEPSPKMRLNTADTTVFHDLVAEGRPGSGFLATRPSHHNLKAAFDEATLHWRQVSQPLNPNDQVKILQKWMNFIRYNAKVILLKVPSSVNAFKMFETLNDRGLKTSQADLVKNYILGQSGDDVEKSQEMWGYLKGALEAIAEEDITVNFLRQALICQHGSLVSG